MNKKVLNIEDVDLKKLKSKLRHGDMVRIAETTGYSQNYVWRVLEPTDKRTNPEIVKAAIRLLEERYSVETESGLADSLVA